MAFGRKRNNFYPILLWTLVLGFTIVAGAIFYKAFQQGTENRTKAAKKGEVYYQWNFNKPTSDFLGWKPDNLTLTYGKEKRTSGYLLGIVGENIDPPRLSQYITDGKVLPVGVKKLTISMAVHPAGSSISEDGQKRFRMKDTQVSFSDYSVNQSPLPSGNVPSATIILEYANPGADRMGDLPRTPLLLDDRYHEYSMDLGSSLFQLQLDGYIRFTWIGLSPGSKVKINWIRVTGSPMSISPTPPAKKCVVTKGCGPDVCAPEGASVVSICDMRPEYECIKYKKCEVQSSGQCGFTQTPESTACLQMFRNPNPDCCSTEKKQQGYKCVKDCAPGNRSAGDYQPSTTYSCLSSDIAAGRERFLCPP